MKLMIGQKFGRLTVTSYDAERSALCECKWNRQYYRCLCECGNEKTVEMSHLNSGHSKSCGCLRFAAKAGTYCSISRLQKHGMSRTPVYKTWCGMIKRCNNPNSQDYRGRGIKVCDRWLEFENFYSDMGNRPTPDHSIDRINNDGDYCPENCRWATSVEQANNKRNNRNVTVGCVTLSVSAWEREMGFKGGTIKRRIYRGWSDIEAVINPLMSQKDVALRDTGTR